MKRLPSLADGEGLERTVSIYFWDPSYPGLGARLNRDDSIAWILKIRIGGKVHWKTLGTWPDMKTWEAKAEVDGMKTRIRQGEDTGLARFVPILWPDLVDKFEREHLPNLKAKTKESYQSALRLHVRSAFMGKLAHEIEESDIRDFHQTLGKTGKTRQANVCLGMLRMIFDRAEAWKHRPLNSNPVDLLRKGNYRPFRETPRHRPLEDDELARLGEALVTMEGEGYGQFCDFVRVLYFSGPGGAKCWAWPGNG
ncbi:MAG: integrase arm-type DNA-binding domain-containing protein [Holophagaceae bacterium]|nr:integrase arm-type DNA-binding domain-containing protein [Holophagaceae bacterium]